MWTAVHLEVSGTRKTKDFKELFELLNVRGSSAAGSRLENCIHIVVIVEGKAHRIQYSHVQVSFTSDLLLAF